MSSPPRLPSRCSGRRAPTKGTTLCWRARSQARATATEPAPSSSATSATASMTSQSAAPGPPTCAARAASVTSSPRRYLPDKKPFFDGLHGTRASPWSRANGASSPATSRARSEYSTWTRSGARAVHWIRDDYAASFRVADVTRLAGMSTSAFHRNFQAVTAMSPIQFQKPIRLQEARLILAGRSGDMTAVSQSVGYDSASQFSREYRRLFGVSPSQDARRLRASGPPPPVPVP
ncbi:AraC family transcriptional regulator [Streptomyces sp. PLK6-54]|uniref:AraC family transcriptional regulator n=1 Tax=Actinacidiphila acidipaludis TaxID=2873382 RepID=A0ABS7Q4A4_9ACTN|nr:AraC family transcriptional regulator [Streptomyces acidipaludis]